MQKINLRLKQVFENAKFKRALQKSCAISFFITLIFGSVTQTPLFNVLNADFANLFLATTAQVLAGTTAIIFTVSALVISIASDRYTAQLLSRFVNDPLTIGTFITLLACMLIALFAIGVDAPMYQVAFLLMVFFINVGVGLLFFYLQHTLSFINPDALSRELTQEGLQALKNENSALWNKVVSSMGDITLKAIARGEENVTLTYIEGLYKLQSAWMISKKVPLHRQKDWVLASMKIETRSPIFNQYKRILDKLAKDGDENLVIAIRDAASNNIESLIQQRLGKQMLRGLLAQYHEFVEMVIDSRHSARFVFLYAYRPMIWQEFNQNHHDDFLPIVLHAFINICEIIVNKDDRELFDQTLSFFCSGHSSLNDATPSLQTYDSPLYNHLSTQNPRQDWNWLLQWEVIITKATRPYLTSDTYKITQASLTGMSNAFKHDEQAITYLKQTQETIHEIYIITHIINAFFSLGIRILAAGKSDFLKLLWNRPLSTPSPYMNRVPRDLEFVISQIILYTRHTRRIAHNQQESTSTLQYSFLYFAYALQQQPTDNAQQLFSLPLNNEVFSDRYGNLSSLRTTQIKTIYEILVAAPLQLDTIVQQYDAVTGDDQDWDVLFNGNAHQAFDQAKVWLTNVERRNAWKEIVEEIPQFLPLDRNRKLTYFNQIREQHRKNSALQHLANIEKLDASTSGNPLTTTICALREKFTLLGRQSRFNDIGNSWKAIKKLNEDELQQIIQVLVEHKQVQRTPVQALHRKILSEYATQLQQAGYTPTALIISSLQMRRAEQNQQNLEENFQYIDQQTLKINDSTNLRTVMSNHAQNWAILLSPHTGIWQSTHVQFAIENCPNKPTHVHVKLTEKVKYQLVNPSGISVLELPTLANEAQG